MTYEQVKELLDAGFTAAEIRTFSGGENNNVQEQQIGTPNTEEVAQAETSTQTVDVGTQVKNALDEFLTSLQKLNANTASRDAQQENTTANVTAKIMKGV